VPIYSKPEIIATFLSNIKINPGDGGAMETYSAR
jgi:hypothetical protein